MAFASSDVEFAIVARPSAHTRMITLILVMSISGIIGISLTVKVLLENWAFEETYGRGIRMPMPDTPWGHPGGVYVVAVAGVVFGACWLLSWSFGRAVERETAAGYTTLRSGRRSVPEVDPRSGKVVRAVGEPGISAAARSARLRSIRRL